MRGKRAYTPALGSADALTGPKVESHWEAVPPELCRPADCGKEVAAIAFERPIGEQGAEFIAAIAEGETTIESRAAGMFRVAVNGGTDIFLFAPADRAIAYEGLETDAECAAVCYKGTTPAYACAMGATRLSVAGTASLSSSEAIDTEVLAERR